MFINKCNRVGNQSIVGAGLGTKLTYSPITEQQNPPFPTDNSVGAGLGTQFGYLPITEQQNPPFPTDN
ncbi:MAG: hypothetical protein RID53_01505 [Coleofasciculus sp. B1-GNL1-01]|uniref:hypothetical protein n=1 Tax=Coleofasciculus sp. B1-GNL1-01 TaxID=3068484 RepID=UPI0033030169